MNEPAKIKKGLKHTWTESLSDYPATTYTLKYNLVNASKNEAITSTADGSDHDIEISAATSAAYTAGTYKWQSYVQEILDSTNKIFIAEGMLEIEESLLTGTTDFRTHAKKTLDAINTVIENWATQGYQSISVNGRAIQYKTLDDLMKLKAYYTSIVNAETAQAKIDAGEEPGGKILTRFRTIT